MTTRYFRAQGRVQGVWFRQSLVRGTAAHGLAAGATNRPDGSVAITFEGDDAAIDAVLAKLGSGRLNDRGAQATSVEEEPSGLDLAAHDVHPGNLDRLGWDRSIRVYL
jgi:acylphosphatase